MTQSSLLWFIDRYKTEKQKKQRFIVHEFESLTVSKKCLHWLKVILRFNTNKLFIYKKTQMYESRFFFFVLGGAVKGEGYFDFWSTAWSVWVIRGWLDESACEWGKGLDWNGIWGEGCAAGHAVKTKMSTPELKSALFISGVHLHITKSSIFYRWREAEELIRQSAPTHTHTDTRLSKRYNILWVWCCVELQLASRQKSPRSFSRWVRLLECQESNLRSIYKAHILCTRSTHTVHSLPVQRKSSQDSIHSTDMWRYQLLAHHVRTRNC